jgi:hypothetical protein
MTPAECLIRDQLALRRQRPAAATQPDRRLRPDESEPAIHSVIRASSNGDNPLIQAPRNRVAIHELFIWLPALSVDLSFWDGPSAASYAVLLLEMDAVPVGTGFALGYQADPHFILRESNPLILHLSAATTVTGFLKYRVF